jgi:hypothetical protein
MANAGLHAAIGMAIVKIIPIWWISLPLAFISHFFMDLYPEASVNLKNYKKKENLLFTISQIVLVLFVVSVAIIQHSYIMIIAAFLSNLPDLWDEINSLLKRKNFWFVHGGNFPFKVEHWQYFCMTSFQNAVLDIIFVTTILLLIIL